MTLAGFKCKFMCMTSAPLHKKRHKWFRHRKSQCMIAIMIEQSKISHVELLHWYKHAGVDLALDDEPVDQFAAFKQQTQERRDKPAQTKSPLKLAAPSHTANQMSGAAIPDENAIVSARELAKSANSLEELRKILTGFKGCNLRLGAKNLVFGDGNPNAGIMLVGEVPDLDEDTHGLPFVGRAGQLLDKMLAAINLDREKVYLSNVIPWRPPGNRTPTPAEIEICRPFIERHIELIAPKLLILLGESSAKTLLDTKKGILKLRGQWKKYPLQDGEIDCMPTLHPTYLLRQPVQKRLAWRDLLKVQERMG